VTKPPASLSQHEIDALLSAVHSGTVAVSPGGTTPDPAVVRYNFRRPSRVSKEQIRGLQVVHEDFAKLASSSFSAMLRTFVEVELEAVEQAAYSEYVMAISTPTCAFLFNMEPLKGGAVLEVNPQLAYTMIDRLLGGQGMGTPPVRDFTEIERAIIERVGLRSMVDLQQSWQQIGAFVFRVLNLETNPQLIQVTAPNEVVIVATLRLKIGETAGGMTVAYPHLLLESTISRLGTQRWQTHKAIGPKPEERARVMRELSHTHLTLRAFLGRAHLTVRELLSLHAGQLIPLEVSAKDPVRVEVNRVPKFAGRPGTHRNHLAVEILTSIDERSEPA
jgi:flagellar motor switch protein FliM